MNTAAEHGRIGELAAMKKLRREGYLIEALNWRNGVYEIDIVASKWNELHIIEVKTRQSGGLTTPEMAITPEKFRSLRRAASFFTSSARYRGMEVQFDLIAVELSGEQVVDIRHIQNAMQCDW